MLKNQNFVFFHFLFLKINFRMAKSKFEYVKQFETEDKCLPNCWIVVRIDGKGFHRYVNIADKSNGRNLY